MSKPLEGRIALVTGSSRGLGRAIAIRLGALGASVMVHGRDGESADETVRAVLEQGAPAAARELADLRAPAETRALALRTLDRFGRVDVLVNNAGIECRRLVQDMSDDDWDHVLEVNVGAAVRLCRELLPGMRARRWGRVINVASVASYIPHRGSSSYVTSKHAILGFTKALAAEVDEATIRVNAIALGPTEETGMMGALTAAQREKLLQFVPMARMAKLDEVAATVDWLVTRATSSGSVVHASGGALMG